MITDLVGVTFWTEDVPRLARFYREVLGLRQHSDHGDFVAFEIRPGMRLNVGRHSRVQGPARDPYRVMVNLAVDDIHAEYRRLTALGVPFLRPPEREHWGGWVATLQDPDGNLLQLFQMPERS